MARRCGADPINSAEKATQPMTRLTCDRCDCVPVVKANERLCPAGGVCLGTSVSSDDGKVRTNIDNPNHSVVGAKQAGLKAPQAPKAAPAAPEASHAAPKATASSVAPEAPEAAPAAPAPKVN